MRRTTWAVYVLATITVAGAYFLLPTTSLSKLVLYNGIGLSAVVGTAIGIRKNKPQNARAWKFIVAGMASFLAADIVYYVLEAVTEAVPFPSPADGLYLAMYPLVIYGLLQLIRQVSPGRDLPSLVDAAIVAVGTFAVLGILVMDTYLTDAGIDLSGRLISLAYPVMDVALVAVAARLMGAVHLRHPSYALMSIGLLSLLVADTIYGVLNSAGNFQTGGFADAFWLGFYVLIGAAALHPAVGRPLQVRNIAASHLSRSRLGMLCLVVLGVPTIDLMWGEPFDKILTASTSMLMFLLVLLRLMGLMGLVQRNEQQARHDSLHDSLTGLANRVLFSESVARSVEQDGPGVVSVLFVDLDDFKTVNDSLGHQAGDDLLIAVADRLRSCVRDRDLVARLSGDEFAVLLESAVDRQDAIAVAQRMQDSLAIPIAVGGREVLISASVGIAVEPRADIDRPDVLLQAADVAMYRAKSKGKGRFEFFEHEMYQEAIDRLDLKSDLQVALERGQFELYYQPIVNISDERITSVEALIRWHHPERGLVTPDSFIPLAEQTGLIVPIGRWVLREACMQVTRWQQAHPELAPKSISVNLSVRQMHDARLIDDVFDALSESGLDPRCLTLEITESMLVDDTDRAARVLDQLKAMQVKIAIDDFGTGYSSLSYLRRFPVDMIKIDRSFVSEMEGSATSEALVRTVIDLAHVLQLTTVAEGIEERSQATTLSSLNCTLGQGYLFSRPLPAAQLEDLLRPAAPEKPKARTARPLDTVMFEGRDSLEDLTADLGPLHTDLDLPVMARMRWMQTWADVNRAWTPWSFVVRERGGRIEGAALLARHDSTNGHDIVALGHGLLGSTRLAVRSPRAAKALAKALMEHLDALDGPWTLELEQLPEGDPVAKLLAQRLPNAELGADLWVPSVDLRTHADVDSFFSKNMRRQIRKAQNRIEADGLDQHIDFARSEAEIRLLLPQLEQIHVERDHSTGRSSDLDDPAMRELWRRLVLSHAESGQVEVATMSIDHRIVAFVIGLLDGTSYRVFDGHFDSDYSRYSPGRLVERAVMNRALLDEAFTELDWMAGVAAEKILAATDSSGRMRLAAATRLSAGAGRTVAAPDRR